MSTIFGQIFETLGQVLFQHLVTLNIMNDLIPIIFYQPFPFIIIPKSILLLKPNIPSRYLYAQLYLKCTTCDELFSLKGFLFH